MSEAKPVGGVRQETLMGNELTSAWPCDGVHPDQMRHVTNPEVG